MMGPPNGLPQPPMDPQQPDPTAGATLAQANPPPGNPYLEQYLQTHQMLDQQAQALKTPLAPDPPSPSLLESLATFGLANLKHHADVATTREQNYIQHQKNLAIDQHTNDMALKATDAQATATGLAGKANLAQLTFQLRLLEAQQRMQEAALREGHAKVKEQMPMPTTPEGMDMANAAGMEQDPEHPRYMRPRLTKNPTTGAYELPAAGSAARAALDAVGGGASSSDALPGEKPQDVARRKAREAKPIEGQAQKDVTSIDQSVMDAQEIEKLAADPEVQKYMGPMMGRIAKGLYTGGVQVNPKVSRYIQKVEFLRAAAVGPLLHGSRNPQVWKQIQAHLPQTGDQPALAMEKLKGLSDLYKTNREILLQDSAATPGDLSATTSTPTSTSSTTTTAGQLGTGRRLSSGKLIFEDQ